MQFLMEVRRGASLGIPTYAQAGGLVRHLWAQFYSMEDGYMLDKGLGEALVVWQELGAPWAGILAPDLEDCKLSSL